MLAPLFFLSFIGGALGACTWKPQVPDKAIDGYNDKRLPSITLQQCISACEAETDFLCLSIEHYDGEFGQVCYLSKTPSADATLVDYKDYVYIERDCPIDRPHSCYCMGDPHCYSFDRVMAHFMGTCYYTMARDGCENNFPAEDPTWEVIVNMDKYHPSHYVSWVVNAVINFYDFGLSIEVFRDNKVLVNGNPVLGFPFYPARQITITKTPTSIYINTKTGIQVVWYPASWQITVNAPEQFKSKMCGLCGDANGNAGNDWTIGNADICLADAFPNAVAGSTTDNVFEFGYSWTSGLDVNEQQCVDSCPTPPEEKTCADDLQTKAQDHCRPVTDTSGPFQDCISRMSEDERGNFADNCHQDACFMDNFDTTVCNHAATLQRFCAQLYQVQIQWRSESLCPLECDGEGMTFKACGSVCMPTCSDLNGENCGDTETCEEGCFCEDGLVYDGEGACIDRAQCGCAVTDQGGVFVNVGTTFLTDDCAQQCSCDAPQAALNCVEFSCPDLEVCTAESGERKCECQTPNYLNNGVCEPDDCALSKDSGTGTKTLTRYYWDSVKRKCKTFTYKGEGGTANNFKTKKACKTECTGRNFPEFCKLPKDRGTGTESVTRYYYNQDTNKCKKMEYLGNGGNDNNFANKAECRAACK